MYFIIENCFFNKNIYYIKQSLVFKDEFEQNIYEFALGMLVVKDFL